MISSQDASSQRKQRRIFGVPPTLDGRPGYPWSRRVERDAALRRCMTWDEEEGSRHPAWLRVGQSSVETADAHVAGDAQQQKGRLTWQGASSRRSEIAAALEIAFEIPLEIALELVTASEHWKDWEAHSAQRNSD
eukprot:CAMPEP_0119316134 /NCGR_PEP_ID=MMETSP1333-20130426/38723_1 /TAXON_ID=418940 /ORGANISM="Scyphosphaera apsteinii, Strain RCC1455" /LENGTH=134 /DNA_ID=CAMNT_0007321709 /DNA_START=224 /DNA_END=629 /DNA_ORIENTATION=-